MRVRYLGFLDLYFYEVDLIALEIVTLIIIITYYNLTDFFADTISCYILFRIEANGSRDL